ncbi:MAG: tetratricopeptide repeat-containing protein kinase family protein [Phycisphaerales bacterium]
MIARKLGEGGFGEVWLAEHKRTKGRRVFKFCFNADRLRSLKRELTLFRLLRDALGDRKDIARLFEVQLEEPPFFLESEFTPSGSLIDWAQDQGGIDQVPLQTRLDLVSQTARAVAAAHSVGILHKDIKPGNILIYENEVGQPRPRLADFGIGTLTDQDQLKGRNITMAGFTVELPTDDSSRATTRMYSPPELLAGRPFTVLGDIYALGVFLYQMAVGDLERPLAQGWERDIADPVLREDIAACIEGDEEQRMGSAQGLAKLLEALPQRRRANRRRRAARIAAVGSGALTVLLVVATIWGVREFNARRLADSLRVQAEQEQIEAEAQRDTASALNEVILQGLIRAANPATKRVDIAGGREVTVAEALDDILEVARERLADKPDVHADVLQTVGVALKRLGLFDKAEKAVRAALKIREGDFGNETAAVAESLLAVADVLWYQHDYESALPLYERSLAIRRKLFDEYSPQVAESLNNQGVCLNSIGRRDEAESMILQALEIRRALLAEGHDGVDPMDVAGSANNLAVCLRSQKVFQGAIERFQTVLELAHQFLGESHVYVARTLQNIAECYDGLEQYEEAERYYHDAVEMKLVVLGEDHISVAKSQVGLARVMLLQGDPSQAETSCRAALEVQRNASPPVPWLIATTENLLGACLVAQQRYEDAEPLLVDSLSVIRARWGDQDPRTEAALDRLVDLYESWGKPDDAASYRKTRSENTPQ